MGIERKDILVVMVTAANQNEAVRIAEQCVRSHHAACATTIPMAQSTYWWEGKVVQEDEVLILLKTTEDRFLALQTAIQQMHSYKVPEIIGIPVQAGLPQYIEWVRSQTS